MPRNYFPRRDRGGAAASRRRGETAEDLTKVGLATWDHSHRDGAAATWITDKRRSRIFGAAARDLS